MNDTKFAYLIEDGSKMVLVVCHNQRVKCMVPGEAIRCFGKESDAINFGWTNEEGLWYCPECSYDRLLDKEGGEKDEILSGEKS